MSPIYTVQASLTMSNKQSYYELCLQNHWLINAINKHELRCSQAFFPKDATKFVKLYHSFTINKHFLNELTLQQ